MPTLAHPFRVLRRAYALAQETVSQHSGAYTVRDYFPEAVEVFLKEGEHDCQSFAKPYGCGVGGRFLSEADASMEGKTIRRSVPASDVAAYPALRPRRILTPDLLTLVDAAEARLREEGVNASMLTHDSISVVHTSDNGQKTNLTLRAEDVPAMLTPGSVTRARMCDGRSVEIVMGEPLSGDDLDGIMSGPEMMPNDGERVGPSAKKAGAWVFDLPTVKDEPLVDTRDDPGQISPERSGAATSDRGHGEPSPVRSGHGQSRPDQA